MTRKLKCGLELEFGSNVHPAELMTEIRNLGIDIVLKDYGHDTEENITYDWKVTCDGSVHGYRHGLELVSKPFTDLKIMASDLRLILKVLKKHECGVNESMGIHVHHCIETHGLSNSDILRLVTWYSQNDRLIFPLIAKHRIFNHYCKPYTDERGILSDEDIYEIKSIFGKFERGMLNRNSDERYHNVNICSKFKYNTIEFRQKESTFDIDDIMRWIHFTNACMVYAKTFKVYNTFKRHDFGMDDVKSMFNKLQLDIADYRDCYAMNIYEIRNINNL